MVARSLGGTSFSSNNHHDGSYFSFQPGGAFASIRGLADNMLISEKPSSRKRRVQVGGGLCRKNSPHGGREQVRQDFYSPITTIRYEAILCTVIHIPYQESNRRVQ